MSRIVFNVPNVIFFLRTHGEVYTIRRKRSTGISRVYFGNNLVAIGYVSFVTNVCDKSEIERYLSKSGFKSVDDWFDLAVKLHGTRKGLKLYHVKIIRWIGRLTHKNPSHNRYEDSQTLTDKTRKKTDFKSFEHKTTP